MHTYMHTYSKTHSSIPSSTHTHTQTHMCMYEGMRASSVGAADSLLHIDASFAYVDVAGVVVVMFCWLQERGALISTQLSAYGSAALSICPSVCLSVCCVGSSLHSHLLPLGHGCVE